MTKKSIVLANGGHAVIFQEICVLAWEIYPGGKSFELRFPLKLSPEDTKERFAHTMQYYPPTRPEYCSHDVGIACVFDY